MVILVCGSRDYRDLQRVDYELDAIHNRVEVYKLITGGCSGPDIVAQRWGVSNIVVENEVFKAKWNIHGKAAGPIRNQQMLDEGKPNLIMAFWDGKSAGTKDMINRAIKAGVEVRIYPPPPPQL